MKVLSIIIAIILAIVGIIVTVAVTVFGGILILIAGIAFLVYFIYNMLNKD